MNDLWFARPLCWLAVLPLAGCWWAIWRAGRKPDAPWHGVVDAHLLPHLVVERRGGGRRPFWLALLALAWLVAVAALAGPRVGKTAEQSGALARVQIFLIEIPEQGGLAEDVRRNWARAKQGAQQLLQLLPNHETAMVLYSRQPFLLLPPTTDRASLDHLLQSLSPGLLPDYGARPDLALRMAADVVGRNGFRQADVVWLTAGDIGPVGATLPTVAGSVSILYYGTDERLARRLRVQAQGSGGFFHNANQDLALASIPELQALLARPDQTAPAAGRLPVELGPALILLILPLALGVFRPALLLVLLACGLSFAMVFPNPAQADEARLAAPAATKAGQLGDRLLAAAGFVDPCWRAVANFRLGRYRVAALLWSQCPGADAAFNRGNALVQAGRFNEALGAYDEALQLRADDVDFQFNRRLVQTLLNPPPPPPAQASPAPSNSVAPDARQIASADPLSEKSFNAKRLSEKPGRTGPDTDREFLRRLILLQDKRRSP